MSSDETLRSHLARARVIPVLVIDRVEDALPLAQALVAGGLRMLEITLRTPAAWPALELLLTELEGAEVGAGTVTAPAELARLAKLGAGFAVSPGLTPTLLSAARDHGLPLLPGVMTTSELMLGREAGLSTFKFFPAEAAGGPPLLAAWAGPFPDVAFCPTGGITPETASAYLRLPNVVAVGTSWVAPKEHIAAGNWVEIRRRAEAAKAW